MSKIIKLTQGYETIVDNIDYEFLIKYKWHVNITKACKRAVTNINKHKIFMHRVILNARPNEIVDHKNGNSLDNRRRNLRIVTSKQNAQNSIGKNITQFKGVHKRKENLKRPYRAGIYADNKQIWLGYFENELDAAKAYNEAAIKYFGEYAKLNNID